MLIFARISGIFATAPVFSGKNINVYVKAGLCLLLSYILLPLLYSPSIPIPDSLLPYIFVLTGEFLFGVIFGYISQLVFYAMQMAGFLLDTEIGFGVINIIDPSIGQQVPLLGNFLYLLGLIFFLVTNGHHIFLSALFYSFKVIPLTGVVFHISFADFMVNMVAGLFVTGFKIAVPVISALILADVAMGILARTMPQMNIFIVGMPAKILIGLFVFSLSIPFYVSFLEVAFDGMYKNLYLLMPYFQR
jgi:flagellar biosynthetic protein FliR